MLSSTIQLLHLYYGYYYYRLQAVLGFFGSLFMMMYACLTLLRCCDINSVRDSFVRGLYFTQRCVFNSVSDSFVCGSVGPNPHALSALTMSTQEPIFYQGDTELFRYRVEIFRAMCESLTMAFTPCFWNYSITLGICCWTGGERSSLHFTPAPDSLNKMPSVRLEQEISP